MSNGTSMSPLLYLYEYLTIFIKRWRLIAGPTIVIILITVGYSLFLPAIYTAKTMILPGEDDKGGIGAMMAQLGGMGGIAGIAGAGLGGPSKADLYVTMLKSETVKDPIIERFKLMDLYKAKYRVDAYTVLDKNVVITLDKKDGVVTILVDDKNPQRAADIANAYVDELGKLAVRLNVTSAGKNRSYLEERLAIARAELSKAEDSLKAFQTENKTVSVTDQAKATIEGVAQLRAQLAAQEVQLATTRRQFTESSQEVKAARTAVANIRAQIVKLEGNGGRSSIPSVGNVPELSQEYIRLMRNFKTQEALVELLTKQYEVSKLSEVNDVAPVQVLQKAKVPERRSKPVRRKMVMIAFLLSFPGSCVLALALENHEKLRTAKSSSDV